MREEEQQQLLRTSPRLEEETRSEGVGGQQTCHRGALPPPPPLTYGVPKTLSRFIIYLRITTPEYNIACKNFILSSVIINRYGFVRFWKGKKEVLCIFYAV